MQQRIEERQPAFRVGCIRGIPDRKPAADDLIHLCGEAAVQHQGAVGHMNAVCLWWQIVHMGGDLQQFDDAGDFLGDVGGGEGLQQAEDFRLQGSFVDHTPVDGEEGVLREGDLVRGKELLAEKGLTGEFKAGGRSQVEAYFVARGGIASKSVTKKTDYLIVGELGSDMWSSGNYGSKVKKAMELQEKGSSIVIVKEGEASITL